MDLPSFLWLWKIAAWAMGFTILAYLVLAGLGLWLWHLRRHQQAHPTWLRPVHIGVGILLVGLVLLLLGIGLVGTIGHYGSLGHSWHLPAGLAVVDLVFLSAWAAVQIYLDRPWARLAHRTINLVLFVALGLVSWSGWQVVQKYLPDSTGFPR